MDFTVTLSNSHNVTPFEILKQDKDSVIMLINYYIEKGRNTSERSDAEHISSNATEKELDRDFWNAI